MDGGVKSKVNPTAPPTLAGLRQDLRLRGRGGNPCLLGQSEVSCTPEASGGTYVLDTSTPVMPDTQVSSKQARLMLADLCAWMVTGCVPM